MNYEFAVLEQNIVKHRRILAQLTCVPHPDFYEMDGQRDKLDRLYKERRKQAANLAIVRFFENTPQEIHR